MLIHYPLLCHVHIQLFHINILPIVADIDLISEFRISGTALKHIYCRSQGNKKKGRFHCMIGETTKISELRLPPGWRGDVASHELI